MWVDSSRGRRTPSGCRWFLNWFRGDHQDEGCGGVAFANALAAKIGGGGEQAAAVRVDEGGALRKSGDVCGWEAEGGWHAVGVRSPVTRACTAMFMRGFSETVCDREHRGGHGQRRGPQSAAISAASALASASAVRQAGAASLSERDHWVVVRK